MFRIQVNIKLQIHFVFNPISSFMADPLNIEVIAAAL